MLRSAHSWVFEFFGPLYPGRYWNDTASLKWELILALLALILLLGPAPAEPRHRRRYERLLAGLGLLAGFSYFNFGFFHFSNYVHNWDAFHYYIGAKYFPELRYERLYDCLTVADAEDGVSNVTASTRLTNLHNNNIESAASILANPQRCTENFSAERWQEFKHDVAYFRNRENPARWVEMRTDHGFNATPVWAIAGNALTSLAPASDRQLLMLTLLDLLYWLAACVVIAWAFGWRTLCVSLLVFATFVPCRFYWTGGSILRWDWLFYMVASIACLKKQQPLLGGAALGYAMLLRVFPGTLFLGPVLLVAGIWWRERRVDRDCLRFCAGGLLVTALLVPVSLWTSDNADVYGTFLQNSVKHTATPLTNNMGLRTVLSYRPSEAGQHLRDGKLLDPWQPWKDARRHAFDQMKIVWLVLVLGFVALFWRALRYAEPWTAVVLGVTLIPAIFELTGYYYAFILALALLAARRPRHGLWLLGLSATSGVIAWAPLAFMPQWLDEQSVWMSIATLLVFALLLLDSGRAVQARPESRKG